ncbi:MULTISPECIES: HTH-type transcriptional regulator BhcR [unclassified Phaeobacter]|uniref:HTH-type transcriptional regulator BhcR n=2 Tax=unclassified Phaeobacter TaxID=2621772 RepID=UPI003A8A780F
MTMQKQKRSRGRPKSQFTESSAGTLQSLDRALGVLTAIARADRLTLTDLSLTVGVPTATTHRILMTLQKHNFVTFDEDRQDWLIGIEAFRTGSSFLKRRNLAEIGRPVMQLLMEQTGETANLAVPAAAEVVFIGQVETHNPIRAFFPPSTRTAMHASGTGKAILSQLSEEKVTQLLTKAGLQQFTANTHTGPKSLFEDLAQIRARGWSFDSEERYEGMSCIGSAIFDEFGKPCAGVSISGPSIRFDDAHVAQFGAAVSKAAAEITLRSGGVIPEQI